MDEKLYTRALKFLTRRPRSEKEVIDNLKKKKATDSQIVSIIDLLKKQKFLDNLAFARWWLEQRTQFNTKGWRVVEIELRAKGISKEILEELRTKSQELRGKNELNLAREMITKRIKRYEGLPKDAVYRKIGGFLGRRGFNLDTIKTIIDEVFAK